MANNRIKVGIIGLGMVGEPVKRWFEQHNGYKRGKDLFCYDADPKKGYSDDVNKADVIFVAVPTPTNSDGSCNTSIVESVVGSLKDPAPTLSADRHSKKGRGWYGAGGKIVVVKSTVTPGTVENLQKKYPKKRFIFNPEFLTESQAWEDFISPDRQIIGSTTQSLSDAVEILNLLPKKNFIRPWTSDYVRKSVNATEAEFGKYASNIFGYMKVIYGNILADMAHVLDKKYIKDKIPSRVSYENIKELIGADLRIGSAWLNVEHGQYSGAGGFCFPKDMNAFIAFGESLEKDAVKKKLLDKNHLKVLQMGLAVLKAVRDYNKTLIESQGLSMEDVSRHNKEIITQKRKKIRA